MRKVARVGMLACAVLMLGHSSVQAQIAVLSNEGLLNGRYSFGARGSRPDGGSMMGGQISRVGTLRFDGIGHVLAARFVETTDGIRVAYGGPSNGGYRFVDGEYSVQNNGLGRITLHFESANPGTISLFNTRIDEIWDISITNDGKSFFLNTATLVAVDTPEDTHGVSENQRGAISGEARVN